MLTNMIREEQQGAVQSHVHDRRHVRYAACDHSYEVEDRANLSERSSGSDVKGHEVERREDCWVNEPMRPVRHC